MTHHEHEDMQVLDALGRVVPQQAPPPALRARVLAAALAEAQEPAISARPALPAPSAFAARAAVAPDAAVAPVSHWPWLLAAAAAVLAVGTSLGWWSAQNEIQRLQSTIADLRTTATELLNVRAEFGREQTARQRAAAILSAHDVTYTALAGVTPAGAARARVYVSPTRGMLMAAEALPALPSGRVYQLWTIVAGQPVSAGVFELEASGRAQLLSAAPGGPADAFAVTVEPAGGVPAPTGPKVLLGVPAN